MGTIHITEDADFSGRLFKDRAAPDFTLPDQDGMPWRLSDQNGRVTAIIFYPKSETLVCRKQLCSLRDNWSEYVQTRAVIVAVSPGSAEEHREFAARYRLPLKLLVDCDRTVTRLFAKHRFLPLSLTRAVVVIDAKGFIRTQKIMLRAFRPSDRSVITAIHAARADALTEDYGKLAARTREMRD